MKNLEAEQALIGALMISDVGFDLLPDMLEPEHFAEPVHGRIFAAIKTLCERGSVATPVTLKAYFDKDHALADVGGASYLARLAGAATRATNIPHYASVVYDMALRRVGAEICEEIADELRAPDPEVDPRTVISEAEERLSGLVGVSAASKCSHVGDAATVAYEAMMEARRTGVSGLATGLHDLDNALGGFRDTDLVILAGRPGMGKSNLAGNISWNVASNVGPVLFVSLEMGADQIAARLLSSLADVPMQAFRGGGIEDEDERIARGVADMCNVPLYIEDGSGLSVGAVRSRARTIKRRHGLALVVIDYLQLMSAGKRYAGNKVAEVSEISASLKGLAKDLRVPVIALSQLSRAVESRDDKRPHLADLRESGAIEQDADVVMMLYRDEYYARREEPPPHQHAKYEAWIERMAEAAGKAEVIIAKHRHGREGKVMLSFRADMCRFGDLPASEAAQNQMVRPRNSRG